MGFSTIPHKPYCIIKEEVFIFFYMNNIIFTFRKIKTGIIKKAERELKIKYQFIGCEEF